jgi:phage terminase large subunit-like protein
VLSDNGGVNFGYRITRTHVQTEAARAIAKYRTVLLEGGGRSGKTFEACQDIVKRALLQQSDHVIMRFRFSHAKQSICFQTMPKVLRMLGLNKVVKLNKSEWFYLFPNGSTIWIGGLDEKERTEKILGNEYATVYLNEASQISFNSYEMIVTRLNPPAGMRGKIIIDYNPPSTQHWGYKMFHKRKYPDGRDVPSDDFFVVKMNPIDNIVNLSPEYIKGLEQLSSEKKRRFLYGEYGTDSGSLWKRSWFKRMTQDIDFMRVVVGVDPSGTVDGDEIGIIVAAQFEDHSTQEGHSFVILEDYSCHGTPAEWASEVSRAYDRWKADIVVAEKNYGGDMVEHTIRSTHPNINVKLINSSRGKILRAEPISALYEKERVYHREEFMLLEDEMCIYEPGSGFSPNRLDAAVFALTELAGEGVSMLDVA